jgi:SAM-dependent methyltransferase
MYSVEQTPTASDTAPTRPGRPVVDRSGKLAALIRERRGVLELGCGPVRRHAEAVTVDALEFDGVDVVGDVFDVLASIPDGCVDAVHSYHFLEHIEPFAGIVAEIARVLRPGGLLHAVVPHFSNPYYYSDYTHRQAFGLYTFSYLADDAIFRRRVPRYVRDTGLVLADVRLNFKAARPFYVRYALRRVLGAVVNVSRRTQEWYEAGWTWWFSCYEIDFEVRRR